MKRRRSPDEDPVYRSRFPGIVALQSRYTQHLHPHTAGGSWCTTRTRAHTHTHKHTHTRKSAFLAAAPRRGEVKCSVPSSCLCSARWSRSARGGPDRAELTGFWCRCARLSPGDLQPTTALSLFSFSLSLSFSLYSLSLSLSLRVGRYHRVGGVGEPRRGGVHRAGGRT